jgi:hypothetical protein
MPSRKILQKALDKEKELQELENRLNEESYWEEGIDKRGKQIEDKINKKQEEKMQRVQEMNNLHKIDEDLCSHIERPKSRMGSRSKLHLSKLEQAFVNIPKTASEKRSEQKQQEQDLRKFRELRISKEKDKKNIKRAEKEYLLNKKSIISDEKLFIDIDDEDVFEEKSIYNALNIFEDDLPDIKVIYKEFYKRNFPVVKDELPGLHLSQYQDKIKKMWEISFENPKNNH